MKIAFASLLGFVFVIFAGPMLAFYQAETEPEEATEAFNFRFQAFGKKYLMKLMVDDLKKSGWDLKTSENPPVSAAKAMRLADAARPSVVKDRDDLRWKRSSLGLMEAANRKWVWVVGYQPYSGRYPEGFDMISIAVLMDGTVMKPKVVDDYGPDEAVE